MIIKTALAIALLLTLFSCNDVADKVETKTQRYQSSGMTYEVVVISTFSGQTRQVVNVTLDSLIVERLKKAPFYFQPSSSNEPIVIVPFTDQAKK